MLGAQQETFVGRSLFLWSIWLLWGLRRWLKGLIAVPDYAPHPFWGDVGLFVVKIRGDACPPWGVYSTATAPLRTGWASLVSSPL